MACSVSQRVTFRELLTSTAGVTGAWAAGVAQPVLDLYGSNATLFTAAKLGRASIVAFALLVAFGGPVVWLGVATALVRLPRLFRIWRTGAIALGITAAGLVVANRYGLPGAGGMIGAVVAVVGLTAVYERAAAARAVVALVGVLAPVSAALFLVASPVARVAWTSPGQDVAIPPAGLTRRPTIVWLVFDETNLSMLLAGGGRIDATRYPNLAALAGTSTWYRNAVGIDSQTPRAVPGLLSSRDGSGVAWPTPADYPVNAFSLLADGYRLDAFEPVTDLCVASSCLPNRLTGARRLRSFLRDAAIVYGTLALPAPVAGSLPRITDAWGGFASTTSFRPTLSKFRRFNHGPAQQLEVADDFNTRITRNEQPTLHFLHVLLPHRPWQLLPDESGYDANEADAGVRYHMPSDLWLAQDEAARFALQAGAMDAVVGRITANLRAQGLWDSTFLVLTADHGVNFAPGSAARFPTAGEPLDDLFRVPLIIHLPGQPAGAISDAPTSTADVLPTLLGVLGARPLARSFGLDLALPVPANRQRTVWTDGVGRPFEPGTATLKRRVATYHDWFPAARSGWERIFARGPYGALLGTRVAANLPATADHRARITLPGGGDTARARPISLVVARLSTPAATTIPDGAIVVTSGGVVVGFLGGGTGTRGGADVRYEGLIDWRIVDRSGALELYLASGTAASPTVKRLTVSS